MHKYINFMMPYIPVDNRVYCSRSRSLNWSALSPHTLGSRIAVDIVITVRCFSSGPLVVHSDSCNKMALDFWVKIQKKNKNGKRIGQMFGLSTKLKGTPGFGYMVHGFVLVKLTI